MHLAPQDFEKGCLSDAHKCKKGVIKELFSEIGFFRGFHAKKGQKGRQKFWAFKWKFFTEKSHSEISVCEFFSRPPKLGARSPPMSLSKAHLHGLLLPARPGIIVSLLSSNHVIRYNYQTAYT